VHASRYYFSDGVVNSHRRAFGRSSESQQNPQPLQGSLVLSGPSGHSRLFRPLVCRGYCAGIVYSFGFIVLWIALIILGVFLRGPGWNLFMPWQYWDPHKVVALVNVDLPYAFGIRTYLNASIFGGAVVLGYFALGTGAYFFMERKAIKNVGFLRMFLKINLLLIMIGIVIKIVLRLAFNIKYIWVTPWFNI
jgi:hypothetical protein